MAEEQTIKTMCPKCGLVFELGRDLIGQVGECTECGSTFAIQDNTEYINQMLAQMAAAPQPVSEPAPVSAPAPMPPVDDEGTVKMGGDDNAATNTVKLSRMKSTGMLPQLKDEQFKVGTINASTQTVTGASRGKHRFSTTKKFSSSSAVHPVRAKKRWWEFWK